MMTTVLVAICGGLIGAVWTLFKAVQRLEKRLERAERVLDGGNQ